MRKRPLRTHIFIDELGATNPDLRVLFHKLHHRRNFALDEKGIGIQEKNILPLRARDSHICCCCKSPVPVISDKENPRKFLVHHGVSAVS